MKIRSDRIYTSNGCINGIIEISEGKIVKISSNPTEEVDYDFTGKIIYPGLVDTHNHGNNGYALRNSKRPIEKRYEEVEAYLFNLAAFGVTGVFPTCSYDNVECIETMAHKETDGAKILGIHVEGPWLKRAGEKGKAAKFPDPTREIAEQMVKDGKDMLKLVALSPDIEGIEEVINVMNKNNINLSLAHTNCNYNQAIQAIEKHQFKTVTHTGNGMTGIHHRDVGTLGAALLDDEVYCEVICDFIHLCKEMVEIIFKLKNHDQLMLVSDNSEYTGLPKGKYTYEDGYIESDGCRKLLTDTGKIQGSNCTILVGLKNIVKEIGIDLEEAWKMTSYNACYHYGIKEKGKIEEGYYADFIVMNDDLEVEETFVEGKKVFDFKVNQKKINEEFIKNNRYIE